MTPWIATSTRPQRLARAGIGQSSRLDLVNQSNQIKWFSFAAILPLVGLFEMLVYDWAVGALTASVGMAALAVAVGLAILRYRLYDIDLIINRTLVYACVTGVLGLVFIAVTALSQSIVQSLAGQRTDLVPGAVGVVVALSFPSVRRRAQALVDRVLPAREERALFFTDIVRSTELLAELAPLENDLRLANGNAARP